MKLLRTIRLDPSDTFVFARAAEPGEWAVPGSFLFWDADPATLGPKERAAFRSGLLGIGSFGFSTLAVVTPITGEELAAAEELLALRLVERLGAPDIGTARAAAREEIAFSASLCDHPEQTLVAVHRGFEEGEMRERFRTLTPRADRPKDAFRAFEFFETDATDNAGEDAPVEEVDLAALAGRTPR